MYIIILEVLSIFISLDVGVYISRVEEGSIAESVGLKPGDSILEVNGRPFSSISHEEALKVCNTNINKN